MFAHLGYSFVLAGILATPGCEMRATHHLFSILSGKPVKEHHCPVGPLNTIDKWEHALAYFSLTICWLFTFYKKPNRKYIIIIACISYGIFLEILQHTITEYRTGDYRDIIANTLGVLLALLIFNLIMKKNQVN